MNILAIETSCDETSVAVVKNGTDVLSCVIATSMKLHAESGGIIPENAARKQIEYIIPTIEKALQIAFPHENILARDETFEQIDAIAVTVGPGLIGSLLVGVETAKTLASVFNKRLIPVNHVQAHIYATFLSKTPPQFPFLSLVVSGGHTDFVYVEKHGSYKRIGGTRDDAAGEAFDKCARIIGLGYPGGPSIAKAAEQYISKNPNSKLTLFPRPMIFDKSLDLSFSGLKTAVLRLVKTNEKDNVYSKEQLAAEVQAAIADSLIKKTLRAVESLNIKSVVLCGGVSANIYLRHQMEALLLFNKVSLSLHVPELVYCTDNAAMVGSCAFFNQNNDFVLSLEPNPELHF